ncbi:hypothetical protein RJ43_00025 [Alteromonas macleodii]|nr:hypothetical protein RJ43_00025 [Alteromonas macleodii]
MCHVGFVAKKNRDIIFTLKEKDGEVIASLEDAHDLSLQHTITGMPNPRVRAPRKSKSDIAEMTPILAAITHKEPKEFLEQNIEGVCQQINEHIHEIRKSLKRMQSLTHYVITAKEILREMEQGDI